MPSSSAPRGPVVILGAGVAGMTAAYRLLQRAHADHAAGGPPPPRVVLLEKDERPGGLAVSISRDGVVTDLGPHRLHTELPEIKALLAEVAEERLLTVRRESHIYWRGQRLKYPVAPFELARKIGILPTAGLSFSALAAKFGRTGATDDADSFENVMRGRFGDGLWRELLGPYVEKVWKRRGGELHGDAARVRVSAGGIADLAKRLLPARKGKSAPPPAAVKSFRYPKGGLQTLVDILAERATSLGAEIRVNAPVDAIELAEAEGGRRRVAAIVGGGERFENPSAVVATIPLPTLGRLLGGEVEASTRALDYLGMLLVVLVVKKDRLSRDNWLYFFDDSQTINRAYEAKNFDPEMSPPGKTALCCEITTDVDGPLWNENREALAERVGREVAAASGLFRADEIESAFVHPLRWAYPIYSLDYREKLRGALAAAAGIANLLPCGRQGLFNHNNTDHSMSMGLSVADAILDGGAWNDGALLERFGHFRIVD